MVGFFSFVALILLVTGSILVVGMLHRLSKWNRTYDKLGKRYAGTSNKLKPNKGGVIYGFPIFARPSLRFDYGRTFCTLRNRKSLRSSRKRQTEISMIWPNRKLKLEISTSPVKSRSWGLKPVAIEDPGFNDQFYVFSNNEEAAKSLLTQNVQWQLEQLRRLGGDGELIVTLLRANLIVSKPGYIKEYQQLDDFVRFALELFDQMMLVEAEGLEFVNENMATVVADVKCPICSEEINDDVVVCTRCKTPHCRDCWHYNGQCATFACSETRFLSIGTSVAQE